VLFQPRGGADLGSETDEAAPGVGGDDRVMRGSAYDIWSVGVLWLELITGSSKVWVRHFAQYRPPAHPPSRPISYRFRVPSATKDLAVASRPRTLSLRKRHNIDILYWFAERARQIATEQQRSDLTLACQCCRRWLVGANYWLDRE
jgi:hypothetical protein